MSTIHKIDGIKCKQVIDSLIDKEKIKQQLKSRKIYVNINNLFKKGRFINVKA